FGQRSEAVTGVLAGRLALAELAAMHGDEARAEALHAGEVLVAGGLVDGAFAAELGLDRDDRQAVRLHPAVAAAFAHGLVDDDALRRIGIELALAPTPLLGGTGLVVDDRGDAGGLAEVTLQPVQLVAVMHGGARREGAAGRILLRLVACDGDALQTLGIE